MKRRQFLQAAGLGLAATAVAKSAIAQSTANIKWRLTASWPKSLDTLYGAAETTFRGEQYLWWQVAEHSYDRFMIRNRLKV